MKKKKILIIALAQSSHTHSWLDLIDKNLFETRLFGIGNTRAKTLSHVFNYVFEENFPFINQKPTRNRWLRIIRRLFYLINEKNSQFLEHWWLERIIKNWQPDVVHTLGLDPATVNFLPLHQKMKNIHQYKWVVTIRGGSDLELERFNPQKQPIFRQIFENCDSVFADNKITYSYAYELGLDENKKPPLDFTPGTGGMDIENLSRLRKIKTSKSRIILWPKACEGIYSKGLPVLEAIKMVWSKIEPCQIIMTVVTPDFQLWLAALPPEIKRSIKTYDRIDRAKLIKIMAKARVALLPSLIDGIPNSLYEAMACKAFPIVSPLETIKTVVSKENVLFARNLYPDEIALALVKAMGDDGFVDKVVTNNLSLVKKVADKIKIGQKVNDYYERLSQ